MLKITFKNGNAIEYPNAIIDKNIVEQGLKNEFWYLETEAEVTFYRVSEIAKIQVSK